jgi:PAS domain S-box-containing protein
MREHECFETLCNTADGVFIVDANKRILRWNKGAEKILGCAETDVLHRECFRVISGKSGSERPLCSQNCRVHSSALSGVPQTNFDMMIDDGEKGPLWLNVSTIVYAGAEDPFIAHIVRDITEEKRKEIALEKLMKDLTPGSIVSRERSKEAANRDQELNMNPEAPGKTKEALSDREIQVLTLLAEGHTTKALAQKLNISHFTARNHIQNILVKLDLHSKAQAVSYAFKQGIL